MGKYILVLDVGTTNIKGFLFDKEGTIIHQTLQRPSYIMEESGQVEQDPHQIWDMSKKVLEDVIKESSTDLKDISALGISTQRASFMFWDQKTGKVHSNIISWQDKRAAEYAQQMTKSTYFRFIRGLSKTLHFLTRGKKWLTASMMAFNSDYASIRTAYYLKHNPELAKEIQKSDTTIRWGTIDSWILWNLTQGNVHATDYSNASSTGMYDPFGLEWNTIVLNKFKIPVHILPDVKDTDANFGSTSLFGDAAIPIRSLIADQQSSLFGQCCFEAGEMKVTNGTGSFVDLNTGAEPHPSKRKLYPLIAWKIKGNLVYKLEGMSHNTGNIIDWIQRELELFDDPSETEKMAMSVDSTNGVFFLPTFTSGISFPYWDPTARGNIFGINMKTKKAHIIRAVLNGICFRIKDFVQGIIEDTGINITRIKADGGVSQNKYVLQFLADILGLEVEHSINPEPTALGAAFVAGLATDFWNSEEELKQIRQVDKIYTPKMSETERTYLYNCWKDIVRRSLNYNNH